MTSLFLWFWVLTRLIKSSSATSITSLESLRGSPEICCHYESREERSQGAADFAERALGQSPLRNWPPFSTLQPPGDVDTWMPLSPVVIILLSPNNVIPL